MEPTQNGDAKDNWLPNTYLLKSVLNHFYPSSPAFSVPIRCGNRVKTEPFFETSWWKSKLTPAHDHFPYFLACFFRLEALLSWCLLLLDPTTHTPHIFRGPHGPGQNKWRAHSAPLVVTGSDEKDSEAEFWLNRKRCHDQPRGLRIQEWKGWSKWGYLTEFGSQHALCS